MNKIAKIILINFIIASLISAIVLFSVFLTSYYLKKRNKEIDLNKGNQIKTVLTKNDKQGLVPFNFSDKEVGKYTRHKEVKYDLILPNPHQPFTVRVYLNDGGNALLKQNIIFSRERVLKMSDLDINGEYNPKGIFTKVDNNIWEYFVNDPNIKNRYNKRTFTMFVQIKDPGKNSQVIQGEPFAIKIEFIKV